MRISKLVQAAVAAAAVSILPSLQAVPAASAPGDFILPPDYEQVRVGLPATDSGTPGGAYCGPTAAADLMQWLDDNGYPEIDFPDATPDDITMEIFQIGLYLDTHPDNGTTPEDFVSGLQDYLDDAGLGDRFEVSYVGRNMGSAVEQGLGHVFATIDLLLNVGNYAIARVGWYELSGNRCGGHYVAVTGYDFAAGDFTARFRDPSDGVLQVRRRGPVVDDFYDLEDPATGGCPAPCIVNQFASAWNWKRSAKCTKTGRVGIQDGVLSVRPIRLFSRASTGNGFLGFTVANGQSSSHAGTSGGPATTLAAHPHLFHLYHCQPGVNAIYKTDMLTNVVTPVAATAPLSQPRRLVFGSGLRLYVLQGSTQNGYAVLALAPNGDLIASTSHPNLTALAYRENLDQILVWSGPMGQVQALTDGLVPVGPTITLPSGPAFANPGYMAVDPNGSILYYNHQGSSSIFRYDLSTGTAMTPLSSSLISDPADMAVDNRGHLFVAPATTGPVVEFDAGGTPVSGSRAASFGATSLLALTRAVRRPLVNDYSGGRRDVDRAIDPGDFDGDADVDSTDFEALRSCFGGPGVPLDPASGCLAGDFDEDFDVDCADAVAFRAAWTGPGEAPVLWDCREPTAVQEPPVHRLALANPNPNPFNPSTTIAFELPRRGHVVLAIHDVRGRRVCTLVDSERSPGRHVVTWDGRDARRAALPSGLYTARLQAAGETQVRKLVLVK